MIYLEDLKMYILAIIAVIIIVFFAVFFYKWQTRPLTNLYCGTFNNNYCPTGVCDYKKTYGNTQVGYCRNKFLSF